MTRIEALWSDVRSAVRALQRSRRYTGWVVGTLAIGMGVTVAALALLNAVLISPFPEVSDQSRLVRVDVSANCGRANCWTSIASASDYTALQQALPGLQGLATYAAGDVAVSLPAARTLRAVVTSPNYFEVLGVRAASGRLFDARDGQAHAPVAVIAYDVWTHEFAADPSVIGTSIRVADEFVDIVGIAPPRFEGVRRTRPGEEPEIWLPVWLADRVLPVAASEDRRPERAMEFVGRLKPTVDASQVQAQAQVIAPHLAATRGQGLTKATAIVQRVWRVNPRTWKYGAIIVLPIPVLVLFIACVNAANLMLARASQRQREIAIRLAIGARRGRIIRQLLMESAMLTLIATAIAIPIALWGLRLADGPWNVQVGLNPTVVTLTILLAAVTTLGFGLAPAVRASAQEPSGTLGPVGARGDAIPRQSRMRQLLVVAQVALSLALLATAWQLVATVRGQALSSGTPGNQLLVARFDLRPLNLPAALNDAFYEELVARTSRLPGVTAAGVARHTAVWTFGLGSAPAALVVWTPDAAPEAGFVTIGGYAGAGLFRATGLGVIAGRDFSDAERQQSRPQVAVVNQSFAAHMKEPVVGAILRVALRGQGSGSAIPVRIVGIIESAVEPRIDDGIPAAKIYLPAPIEPEPALTLYVRSSGAAGALTQPVRELVREIAPRVPILAIGSLDDFNERSFEQQLWLARAARILGIVGLLLATAGLYGVSSYVVALRSRELAIRMALGARPGAIVTMILTQSMRIAAFGLLVGIGAAAAASRMIQAGYYGIRGIDPIAFGGAMTLFVAAMLLASAVPAARAARVDPVENLKDA